MVYSFCRCRNCQIPWAGFKTLVGCSIYTKGLYSILPSYIGFITNHQKASLLTNQYTGMSSQGFKAKVQDPNHAPKSLPGTPPKPTRNTKVSSFSLDVQPNILAKKKPFVHFKATNLFNTSRFFRKYKIQAWPNKFKVEVFSTSSHKIIPRSPASSGDLGWLWWFVSRDYSNSGMVSRFRLASTSRWLPGGRWWNNQVVRKYGRNGDVWRGVKFFVWRVSSFEVQVTSCCWRTLFGECFLVSSACIISRTSLEELNMKIETHVVEN